MRAVGTGSPSLVTSSFADRGSIGRPRSWNSQDLGNAGEDVGGSCGPIRYPAQFLVGSLDQKRHRQKVLEVGLGYFSPVPTGLEIDSMVRYDDNQAPVVETISLQPPEQPAQEPVGQTDL